jgi:hypothetical protein
MNCVFSVSQPGVALAVTTSSARVARATSGAPRLESIRIANTGSSAAFIALGDSTVTAATTDLALSPNMVVILAVNPLMTHVAAITSSSTAQLSIVTGQASLT